MVRIYATRLIGRRVVTSDDVELGDVLDVQLDTNSWQVAWIVIRLRRDVTDSFHVDVPFVMGTKAIALAPVHVKTSGSDILLHGTLAETVRNAVVSFDTDATNHIGKAR